MDETTQSFAGTGRRPASPKRRLTSLASGRSRPLEHAQSRGAIPSSQSNENHNASQAKATGYHNAFKCSSKPTAANAAPPPYNYSARTGCRRVTPREEEGRERLPPYSCSVLQEALFERKMELCSPFQAANDRSWNAVYVVLRGPSLDIHKARSGQQRGPGRLIRSYTLQHAEIGLATDYQKIVYVPQTSVAKLVPESARPNVWRKSPGMFEERKDHVLRLRLETEQFLLVCPNLLDWFEWIRMGIDIATPLDERSIPLLRTLPRRNRNRNRNVEQETAVSADGTAAPAIVQEQERLIRQYCPHLAQNHSASRSTNHVPSTNSSAPPDNPRGGSRDPDYEDLDLTFARSNEDLPIPGNPAIAPLTPSGVLDLTHQSSDLTSTHNTATAPRIRRTNFSPDGKWAPQNSYTPERHLRYRRRIAQVLNYATPRASNVVMHGGRRLRIDWDEQALVPYYILPPSYSSHRFGRAEAPPALEQEEIPRVDDIRRSVSETRTLQQQQDDNPADADDGSMNDGSMNDGSTNDRSMDEITPFPSPGPSVWLEVVGREKEAGLAAMRDYFDTPRRAVVRSVKRVESLDGVGGRGMVPAPGMGRLVGRL